MFFKLVSAVLLFLFVTLVGFILTNNAQPKPYMDEIFHVPQAQQYCAGNFTAWDPMITTLPGLYVASLPLLYPSAVVFSGGDLSAVCTTLLLRGTNILFSLGNFFLLYLITRRLHYNGKNGSEVVLTAQALALFPVLHFFTYLYYTDQSAVFFALTSYYLTLADRHIPAALVGAIAVFFRQTNIVWVLFCVGLTKGKVLIKWLQLEKKEWEGQVEVYDWMMLYKTSLMIGRSLWYNPKQFVVLVMEMLAKIWSYLLVLVGFAAFVVINKGIVVGDRSNHQPCLNIPQVFYFLLVAVFFSWMHMVSTRKVMLCLVYALLSNRRLTIMFTLTAVMIISEFSFFHEYNLSDNRHYNFYFLSKLVRRNEYMRFALIPVYYYSFLMFLVLLRRKDVFWKLSYVVCTAATTIPQRMIEFRYFIIPYLLFRLNIHLRSKGALRLEILFYCLINAFTVHMYVFKPFYWPNSPSVQRFLW